MNKKSRISCEITGCNEFVEYNPDDARPWIYHTTAAGLIHCAGKNPNFWIILCDKDCHHSHFKTCGSARNDKRCDKPEKYKRVTK